MCRCSSWANNTARTSEVSKYCLALESRLQPAEAGTPTPDCTITQARAYLRCTAIAEFLRAPRRLRSVCRSRHTPCAVGHTVTAHGVCLLPRLRLGRSADSKSQFLLSAP